MNRGRIKSLQKATVISRLVVQKNYTRRKNKFSVFQPTFFRETLIVDFLFNGLLYLLRAINQNQFKINNNTPCHFNTCTDRYTRIRINFRVVLAETPRTKFWKVFYFMYLNNSNTIVFWLLNIFKFKKFVFTNCVSPYKTDAGLVLEGSH